MKPYDQENDSIYACSLILSHYDQVCIERAAKLAFNDKPQEQIEYWRSEGGYGGLNQ